MNGPHVCERFLRIADRSEVEDYNFDRFRLRHLVVDAAHTLKGDGIAPGDPAPDFALERADGGLARLSAFRGVPVLLHFGSFT